MSTATQVLGRRTAFAVAMDRIEAAQQHLAEAQQASEALWQDMKSRCTVPTPSDDWGAEPEARRFRAALARDTAWPQWKALDQACASASWRLHQLERKAAIEPEPTSLAELAAQLALYASLWEGEDYLLTAEGLDLLCEVWPARLQRLAEAGTLSVSADPRLSALAERLSTQAREAGHAR